MIDNLPLVTIRCVTYNHEPYIRECLEGFVMQQTNFKFEAVVHDDASTDGTAAIIAEFAEKYPDIIKPLYETENQYSKRDGSIKRIMDAHMRGKYIAKCEGDDYWTDPLKLQKQVDFLEANPDFSMCFHRVCIKSEQGVSVIKLYDTLEQKEYGGNDVLEQWIVPTCSTVYVAKISPKIPFDKGFCVGDNVLFATCAKYGKLYCLEDTMGVYRRNYSGVSTNGSLGSKMMLHWETMLQYFPEFRVVLEQNILDIMINDYKAELRQFSFKFVSVLCKGINRFGCIRVTKNILKCHIQHMKKVTAIIFYRKNDCRVL